MKMAQWLSSGYSSGHGVRADERLIVRDQARMEAHYPQKFRKTLHFMSRKYCPKRLLTKQA
jgi:hypothetical protein